MSLPPKYLANLTPQQRLEQAKLIRKSQKEYQETGLVKDRPFVSEREVPRSGHAETFQKRYGFKVTNRRKLKETFPDTDVSGIVSKGLAAYASSGSRPNTSAHAWAYARVASVLTGGKSYKIDKDLVGPKSREVIF